MSATIRDVAREAGVSVATVSRALNNSGPVKESTLTRVRDVARRMHFSPNTAARSLSIRQTHTLGVLLPEVYGEFFSEIIRGIDHTARQHGFQLLVSGAHNQPAEVEAAVRAMRGRVDGLILMAAELDIETLAQNLPERVPAVLINADHDGSRFDTINIDNFRGAAAMTAHLIDLGHRELRMISGSKGNRDAADRERGFFQALDRAGIPASADSVVQGDFTEVSGYRATEVILASPQRATAIFAANDSMAVGALSALRNAGLRVPEDMAVVGFDDVPIATYVNPPLTTVRVAISSLGACATERLFQAIQSLNRHERQHEVLPTELIIRGSCGASLSHTSPGANQ
jgi:LacI family transcriptional regulator